MRLSLSSEQQRTGLILYAILRHLKKTIKKTLKSFKKNLGQNGLFQNGFKHLRLPF